MIKKTKVSVSTLPFKQEELIEATKKLKKLGADYLHCDIMDGKFVKNTTFQADFLKELSNKSALPLDVHFMVENIDEQVDLCKDLKIDCITFHLESLNLDYKKCFEMIKKIKSFGYKVGITTRHNTLMSHYFRYLPIIDEILIMTVQVGEGGQGLIEDCLLKVEYFAKLKKENDYKYIIAVDGGINKTNAFKAVSLGADKIITGSYVYNNMNKKEVIKELKNTLKMI